MAAILQDAGDDLVAVGSPIALLCAQKAELEEAKAKGKEMKQMIQDARNGS